MWPFSRKSQGNEKNAEVGTTSTAKATTTEALKSEVVSAEELEALLGAFLDQAGAFASILYAQMQGFQHGTLAEDSHFLEYQELIQRHPSEISSEGMEFSVRHFINEGGARISGRYSDHEVIKIFSESGPKSTQDFQKVLSEIDRNGLKTIADRAGFDLAEYIRRKTTEMRDADLRFLQSLFDEKRAGLVPHFRRAMAKSRNKYGDIDLFSLASEIQEFLNTYLREDSLRFFFNGPPIQLLLTMVKDWFSENEADRAIPEDALDFEAWVVEELTKQGWSAVTSKASGDQGVDVVAGKDDLSVAIQCKRYSKPIGNKAVQEAYSGMRHYECDLAAVIGTGGFTRSAEELSASTAVALVDARNIETFTEVILSKAAN